MDSKRGNTLGVAGEAVPGDGSVPSLVEVERRYISTLLEQHDGNRRIVANIMGINERTLYRKLKRYELQAQHI